MTKYVLLGLIVAAHGLSSFSAAALYGAEPAFTLAFLSFLFVPASAAVLGVISYEQGVDDGERGAWIDIEEEEEEDEDGLDESEVVTVMAAVVFNENGEYVVKGHTYGKLEDLAVQCLDEMPEGEVYEVEYITADLPRPLPGPSLELDHEDGACAHSGVCGA